MNSVMSSYGPVYFISLEELRTMLHELKNRSRECFPSATEIRQSLLEVEDMRRTVNDGVASASSSAYLPYLAHSRRRA
jgi:hypothetical protein